MRRSFRRRHQREPAELNITSFMNLMVILVPFLLITAVFSRMAILELNLPSADSLAQAEEPEFSLEIIVRADNIAVGDRNAGVLTTLPKIDGGYDIAGLNEYLQRVKGNFPDQFAATLLLEPQVDYDVLVQVMDAVRSYTVKDSNTFQRAELFPEISVGDAPLLARGD
jgi:biopolymer transport protein ExbD